MPMLPAPIRPLDGQAWLGQNTVCGFMASSVVDGAIKHTVLPDPLFVRKSLHPAVWGYYHPKLYGLTFFGVQTGLQEIMADTLVLPVMDGVPSCAPNAKKAPRIDPDLITAFARQVRWMHHIRPHFSLSIENVL